MEAEAEIHRQALHGALGDFGGRGWSGWRRDGTSQGIMMGGPTETADLGSQELMDNHAPSGTDLAALHVCIFVS